MNDPSLLRCVIVGGGHAAAQLAPALRRFGWTGSIVLCSEEESLPYHRPPLSKDYLKGAVSLDQVLIRRQAVYDKAEVRVRLGERVVEIDRAAGEVRLAGGDRQPYDALALVTGSRPRSLPVPGADLAGVFDMRTARDAEAIREAARPGARAVVIGGGYIGLETAASLDALGLGVTVIEAMDRVLKRVTCPEMSAFFAAMHREEGIVVETDARVTALTGADRVEAVELADGRVMAADLVVVGIGIVPETELAAAAGLAVDDGIVVDEFARTSDPAILAAGDCTRHFNPIYERSLRLESVQNANDQALTAARTICGDPQPYSALPWFWSDQFDVKLQIAGLSDGYDAAIVRGDPTAGRSFSIVYLRQGRLLAVDAVNRPKDFLAAKKLILARARLDARRAADPEAPLAEAALPA